MQNKLHIYNTLSRKKELFKPTGFTLGPFTIHYNGIVIVLGILIAMIIVKKEAARRNKTLDFLIDALPWIFLGGVVGARLWHILTPPQSMVAHGITTRYYLTHLYEAIAIWKGGAGIFGAVIGGTAALSIFAKIKGEPVSIWLDNIAPGLALAQAVGRWGNFINQEVYGLPSNLPWAINIDVQHRLPGFENVDTYHPLFFYEALWSVLNMILLLWVSRKFQNQMRTGNLFLIYLIVYGIGRVGLEFLRLDISSFKGININQAFMAVIVLAAGVIFSLRQKTKPVEAIN
ncbi:MAG: prolipoprotein diacylglyceryl transferase [Anaerolineales bacterium]|nr:prolipoprotein diacylglyceryl transferase [Anaerolineales bacterium]